MTEAQLDRQEATRLADEHRRALDSRIVRALDAGEFTAVEIAAANDVSYPYVQRLRQAWLAKQEQPANDKPPPVKLKLAPMQPETRFRCEHFRCDLTARACVLRQGNRYTLRVGKEGRGGAVGKEQRVSLEFQYCANECVQGPAVKEALGGAKVEPPRKVDFQAQHAARRAAMRPEFAPATFADTEIETEPAIPPAEEEHEDGDRSESEVLAGRRAAQGSAADRGRPIGRRRASTAAVLPDRSDGRERAGAGAGMDAGQPPPPERREAVPDARAGDRLPELPPVAKPPPHAPDRAPPSRPAGRLRARSPAAHCRGDARAAAHREAGAAPVSAPRQQVFWNCGCGRTFQARGFGMHRRGCLFRCAAWPLVIVPPPPQPETARAR